MNFVKSKSRNRLGEQHLNDCLRISDSKHTHMTFPIGRAFDIWWENYGKQNRRGATARQQ